MICETVYQESLKHHYNTEGLPVVPDGTSAVLRSQVAVQVRIFNKFYKISSPVENDATIGATALERDSPLVTGDRSLYAAMLKVGNDASARYFRPGRS